MQSHLLTQDQCKKQNLLGCVMSSSLCQTYIGYWSKILKVSSNYAKQENLEFTKRIFYEYGIILIFYNVVAVKTKLVSDFLTKECGVKYTHLNVQTSSDKKLKETDPNWLKPRGVQQRNEGLHWLRKHLRERRSHEGKRT